MSVEGQEGFRHERMRREKEGEKKRHPQQRMVNRGGGGRQVMGMKPIAEDVKCGKSNCHTLD